MPEIKPLRFLIVDDEPELVELISLMIGFSFSADFTFAYSGNEAIACLEKNEPFDIILSDFNMPNGNGLTLFNFVNSLKLRPYFILITSDSLNKHPEFNNQPKTKYLEKPFTENTIKKLLSEVIHSLRIKVQIAPEYISLPLETIAKVNKLSKPLFLKISDDKFIKIYHEGTVFSLSEIDKLRIKNISKLYVQNQDFNELVADLKKRLMNDFLIGSLAGKEVEALQLSAITQTLITKSIKSIGFSAETQALASHNITLIQKLIETTEAIPNVFSLIESGEHEYGATHSLLISFILADMCKKIQFSNEHALQYLTLAAFYHDIGLSESFIFNETHYSKAALHNSPINKESTKIFLDHVQEAMATLSNWEYCPEEVLRIIKEHHEQPDGEGFPNKLQPSEIGELSACFIVAHEIAELMLAHKNKPTALRFLMDLEKFYEPQPYRKMYLAGLSFLSSNP
jgi:putative nucleotidyltransferase with HDIG domain